MRVAVIDDAISLALVLCLFELAEERIEKCIIVVGQIDSVGIFLQVVAKEAHTVKQVVGASHLEALADAVEHVVDIHFFLGGHGIFGQRGEMQGLVTDGYTFGGEKVPSDAQKKNDGEDKKQGAYGFHFSNNALNFNIM